MPTSPMTSLLLLAGQAAPAPAANPTGAFGPWESLVLIVLVVILGVLAIVGIIFLFMYLTGRLVKRGLETVGNVTVTAVGETGAVLREGIQTTGRVAESAITAVAEGAGSVGRALAAFMRSPSEQTLFMAFCEARPSFEVITCRMSSVVYSKFVPPKTLYERTTLQRDKAIIDVMPVGVTFGFDMNAFKPENLSYDADERRLRVTLPPLRVLTLEKGPRTPLFDNTEVIRREWQNSIEEDLENRMRVFAQSPGAIRIAEENSMRAFKEIVSTLLLLVDPEHRPLEIEVVPFPRERYQLVLPDPLRLEPHHAPDVSRQNVTPDEDTPS